MPRVFDRFPVAQSEMLVGQLAQASCIRVVDTALKNLCEGSLLITQRFVRDADGGRLAYLYSAPGRWRLAPATGLRSIVATGGQSAPSRVQAHGLRCDVDQLLRLSAVFGTPHDEAR